MNEAQKIPWKRISVEAAAIVASILFAFAIDAWWAERQNRIAEREELSRLYDEFASNRYRLNLFVEGLPRPSSSVLSVSEILKNALEDGAEFALVLDTQIATLGSTITFEAESAVYDGLIRSGRIEIIQDRDIVKAMARWERELRNVSAKDQELRRFANEQLLPALAQHNNIQHVLLLPGRTFIAENRGSDAVTKVRVEPLTANLVALSYAKRTEVIDELAGLRDEADRVLLAISNSLGQMDRTN